MTPIHSKDKGHNNEGKGFLSQLSWTVDDWLEFCTAGEMLARVKCSTALTGVLVGKKEKEIVMKGTRKKWLLSVFLSSSTICRRQLLT